MASEMTVARPLRDIVRLLLWFNVIGDRRREVVDDGGVDGDGNRGKSGSGCCEGGGVGGSWRCEERKEIWGRRRKMAEMQPTFSRLFLKKINIKSMVKIR